VIHVVTGHICSGKSTFVQENAGPDDVIVDMDLIASAICREETEHHDYPEHVADIARVLRWFAIDEAVRMQKRKRFDVWIVHAYPDASDIARYRRLGASIKEMHEDEETLITRTKAERPPRSLVTLRKMLKAADLSCAPGVGSAARLPICP
jgi:hypothetical protein